MLLCTAGFALYLALAALVGAFRVSDFRASFRRSA
jgi:hypothetical protein